MSVPPVTSRLLANRRSSVTRPFDWMIAQLPMGMQDDEFFIRFVRIFQDVADTIVVHPDGLPHLADVSVTPLPLVPWLGSWVGVDSIDERMDPVLQRAMVASLGGSIPWRGTRQGLATLLDLLIGADGDYEIDDTGGIYREGETPPDAGGHVLVRCSPSPYVSAEDLGRLIRATVPATVRVTLHVDGTEIVADVSGVR